MTGTIPGPMDALAGLLEERARYEGWLSQLDSHRSNAPAHVLNRVRGDYEERLRGVIDQLRHRAAELEASAAAMQERIATLMSEETARRDERAEAEIRAAVGEFQNEYARDLLVRCDEAIGRLSTERTAAAAELVKVQDILTLVRRPVEARPPAAPSAAPTVEATPNPHAPSDRDSLDELAFLQSVVQPRSAPPPAPPAPAAGPHAGDHPAPSPSSPRRAAQSAPAEASAHEGPAGVRAAPAAPEEVPSFLKDVPTEQAKTLKCQECGTMNYATEWYCERCGGELAAM